MIELSAEQADWRTRCRRFATDVIRPVADELDREARFPREVLDAARCAGLYDVSLLSRFAADPDGLMGPIYSEELHWGCAGVALVLGAATGVVANLAVQGTEQQFAEWAPRCYEDAGRPAVAAFALTEPEAGSDVSALRARARLEGGEWILDGQKSMVNNGGFASVILVVASVAPELGRRGQATFIVPGDTRGLEASPPAPKLGLRASNTANLSLRGCRLPGDAVLGGQEALEQRIARACDRSRTERGRNGMSPGSATAEATRPMFAAGAVGIARAAYEWALPRLDRVPGADGEIAEAIVADVATEIDAARLLAWRAASEARAGRGLTGGEGSMSKLKASETAVWAVSALMDAVGPEAGSSYCPLSKWLRDAKGFQVLEGTSQIQRRVISRFQRVRAKA